MKDKIVKYLSGLALRARNTDNKIIMRLVMSLITLVIFSLKVETSIKRLYLKIKFYLTTLVITIHSVLFNLFRIPGYLLIAIFLPLAAFIGVISIRFLSELSVDIWSRKELSSEQLRFMNKSNNIINHASCISWIILAFFYWRGRIAV